MLKHTQKEVLIAAGVVAGIVAGMQALVSCKPYQKKSEVDALLMRPAISAFPDGTAISATDLNKLTTSLEDGPEGGKVSVLSSSSGFVPEPAPVEGVTEVIDLDSLGYGRSKFLANSRWATIRYVGPNSGLASQPAGSGLSGTAQNNAQSDALGKQNDSVPVVTAAWIITKMMDEFFVPMLKTLPNGNDIISAFKIQGAYFAPGYIPQSGKPERDNAYMVGLQSLYLWPSSCFEVAQRSDCKMPYMGTGHDPTVVGHELTHAIFNHLRGGKSLDGFQWTAVNEGYADYFSASYFSEPRIGRIWKVAGTTVQHLRAIDGKPTTADPTLITEAHLFSTVWSSTLWRVRNRLLAEQQALATDIDRMILLSILYLGETDKVRMGDAGSALLKAAEATDKTVWKDTIRQELATAEIALAQNPPGSSNSTAAAAGILPNAGAKVENSSGGGGACGVIATTVGTANKSVANKNVFSVAGSFVAGSFVATFLAFAPLLFAAVFSLLFGKEKRQ